MAAPVQGRRRRRRSSSSGPTRSTPSRSCGAGAPRLSPTRVIEGAAWTRGGSWTNLIYVLFIARAVKKGLKRQPEILAMDKLKPGQGISITTAARRDLGKRG